MSEASLGLLRGLTTVLAMLAFIDGLAVSDRIKEELRAITPFNYVGIAPQV